MAKGENRLATKGTMKHRVTLFAIFISALMAVPPSMRADEPNEILAVRPSARADKPNDILVVVNLSVKIKELTVEDARDYFLKKKYSWPGGKKAIAVNAKANKLLRTDFREKVLNMTTGDEIRYWQQRQIKFAETHPPEFSNTLKAVFKLKGAISYVYRSDYKEKVSKIVLVIPAN